MVKFNILNNKITIFNYINLNNLPKSSKDDIFT